MMTLWNKGRQINRCAYNFCYCEWIQLRIKSSEKFSIHSLRLAISHILISVAWWCEPHKWRDGKTCALFSHTSARNPFICIVTVHYFIQTSCCVFMIIGIWWCVVLGIRVYGTRTITRREHIQMEKKKIHLALALCFQCQFHIWIALHFIDFG